MASHSTTAAPTLLPPAPLSREFGLERISATRRNANTVEPIALLRRAISGRRDLTYRVGEGCIHVSHRAGYAPNISIIEEGIHRRCILVIGPWHDTFDCAEVAASLALKALNGHVRIKIESRRGHDREWALEVMSNNHEWIESGRLSTIEFWKRGTTTVRFLAYPEITSERRA